jgi:hypothetical protein
VGDERRNVVLGCGIKAPQTGCRLSPEQPVSPDNPVMATAGVVEDQEVIAIVIEAIDVAPPPPHMGQRARSQRLVKYPVSQRLRGIDVFGGFCQANLQRARPKVDDAARNGCRLSINRRGRLDRQDRLVSGRGTVNHADRPLSTSGRKIQCYPTSSALALRALTGLSGSFRAGSKFAATRHGVEFKSVPNKFVAKLISDDFLQSFDLFVAEFDNPSGLQVNQMVMMRAWHFLVSRSAITEIMPRQDTRLFK